MWDQFDISFDIEPNHANIQPFLLASTGRSGSHFLANLLYQNAGFGSPFEYLNPAHIKRWQNILNLTDLNEILRALQLRRTSSNGYFGIKAHWHQFEPVQEQIRFSFQASRAIHRSRLCPVSSFGAATYPLEYK